MFDLDAVLKAHYTCDYDFSRAFPWPEAGLLEPDLAGAEELLLSPCPEDPLSIDPFSVALLFLAYVVSGRQDFFKRASAELDAVLALDNWRYPHHRHMTQVDLGMATICMRLAHLYEELGQSLPDIKARIGDAVISRGLDPFYHQVTDPARPGWVRTYMNWRSFISADMGRVAMRLHDVYPRWRDCVAESIRGCIVVADAGGEDGGWEEGMGYWGMAFGQTANLAEELYAASYGEVNLFLHPYLQAAGDFGLYCWMPGHRTVYGFSDWRVSEPRVDLMYSLAYHTGNPHYQWCVEQSSNPNFRIGQRKNPVAKPPTSLPDSKHFGGIDVAILRSGWSHSDIAVDFKCGPRRVQAHQHLDANSFVLFHGRDAIVDELEDTADGGPKCSATDCLNLYKQLRFKGGHFEKDAALGEASTVVHNTVLFNSYGQLQGKNEWDQFKPTYRKKGKEILDHGEFIHPSDGAHIRGFGQTPDMSFAIGEAAEAYPPPLKSYCRTVILLSRSTVLVADRIIAPVGMEICNLLHVPGCATRKDKSSVEISNGNSTAQLKILACGPKNTPHSCRIVSWRLENGSERQVIVTWVTDAEPFYWLLHCFHLDNLRMACISSCEMNSLLLSLDDQAEVIEIHLEEEARVERHRT